MGKVQNFNLLQNISSKEIPGPAAIGNTIPQKKSPKKGNGIWVPWVHGREESPRAKGALW